MDIINAGELLRFIEDSPEKQIPKSILVDQIHRLHRQHEVRMTLARRRMLFAVAGAGLMAVQAAAYLTAMGAALIPRVMPRLYGLDLAMALLMGAGVGMTSRFAAVILWVYSLISLGLHSYLEGLSIGSLIVPGLIVLLTGRGLLGAFELYGVRHGIQ